MGKPNWNKPNMTGGEGSGVDVGEYWDAGWVGNNTNKSSRKIAHPKRSFYKKKTCPALTLKPLTASHVPRVQQLTINALQ